MKKSGSRPSAENKKKLSQEESNAKLGSEVKRHLDNHKEIDTSNVQISVDKKAVRLTGAVDTAHAKKLATSITCDEIAEVEHCNSDDLIFARDASESP